MSAKLCVSCQGVVSPKAFECPHCGHPLRKRRRGPIGFFFKVCLIAFNVLMLFWLASTVLQIGDTINSTSNENAQTGAAIGGVVSIGIILTIWALGDIILGLATILTRPAR